MRNSFSLASFLFLGLLTFISCVQMDGGGEEAVGSYDKTTLDIDDFSELSLSLDAVVHVRQGSPQSVEIEAKESVIENITRDVRGDRWSIGFEKNMRNTGDIKIWITVPELEEINVSGSGKIIGKNSLTASDELKLAISGSGSMQLDLTTERLSCVVTGSGRMSISGRTDEQRVNISGSGDVEGYDLEAKDCIVRITGSGSSEVNVSDDLEANITGSGDVNYKGDPRIKSRIVGSGDIRSH
ncbi:MAG: head GIN domain-containing protein [Bacteroidota bacterium]